MQITLSSLLSVTRPEAAKGSPSRSYLRPEDASKVLGFKWSLYKTGNIRRASFGGNEISNAEMRSVLHSIEGVYYDKHEKTLKTTESFCEMLSRYDIEIVDDMKEASEAKDDSKTVHAHGGAREGAGRKPTGHITRTIRVRPEQYELLRRLGMSEFLRLLLDRIREGKVPIPVDTLEFTEEERERFIAGWTGAGGDVDDAESENPRFAPWEWQPEIIVRGTTPEEWGADFYRRCKPVIGSIRAGDDGE